MNENFVFDLDVGSIRSGAADDHCRQLLDVWEQNQGIISDELVNISPLLLLFDGAVTDAPAPELLLCGNSALATRLLGDEWADKPAKSVGMLESEYIELIGRGYKQSIYDKKPRFELVSTELQYADEPLLKLRYQRLILPFQTLHGAVFLFCYSHDVGTNRQARDIQQDGKCPLDQGLQNMGQASPY